MGLKEDYELYINKIAEEEKIGFNDNQLRIIYAKYLKRDLQGNVVETPLGMFKRIAKEIAKPDYEISEEEGKKSEKEFFDMMVNLYFIPGGRTLANAGTPVKNLANCFVIPVEDSMEGIFEAVKKAALIQKRGGGVGYCFSTLRPKNSWVAGSSGIASGPISFMRVFDVMCSTIMQGNRRGAQMATFHVWHPDIEDFISAKDDLTQLTNFNISVMIDDKFMNAVENNEDYELIDPHTNKVVRKVNARELFDKIAYHAWKTGEPGVLFVDTANKHNTVSHLGKFKATNPCAEIWLLDYEVCNLGSINLDKMVKDGKVNWELLKDTARKGIHFLDNVIDAGEYPTPEITEMAKKTRRIGLGVLGFADMLYQLGIPYSSEEARNLAREIMKIIDEVGWQESERLAKLKGEFPAWKGSIFEKQNRKVRNCAITAIAPTGTLSMVADSSGGCEPNFAIAYVKNSHSIKQSFTYVNKYFEKVAKERGFYSQELMDRIAKKGTLDGFDEIPEDVKKVFEVAYNIKPEEHVLMQAAFQEYVSNAVSKTINFPESATVEDVKKAYFLAWKTGCKGCTVYRDGSRQNQVLEIKKDKKETEPKEQKYQKKESEKKETTESKKTIENVSAKQLEYCPECNTKLVKQEGCNICPNCGYGACSH
ncbi:MAG: adenosylcobalamin-dependent ribonucleoside-diphosphate reductase [Candidatus Woesearchaeota archaeon]